MTKTCWEVWKGKEELYEHLRYVDAFFLLYHYVEEYQHKIFSELFLLKHRTQKEEIQVHCQTLLI